MITQELAAYGYLIAAICFIMALRGLSSPVSSRQGNLYGVVGMVVAIGVTVATPGVVSPWLIVGGLDGRRRDRRRGRHAHPDDGPAPARGGVPFAGRPRRGVRGGGGLRVAGCLRHRLAGPHQDAEPDRDGAGHRHRRHHLHRLDRGLRQAAGPGHGRAAGLPRPASAQRPDRHRAGRAAGVVRHARPSDHLHPADRAVAGAGLPADPADRRRRHAGRGVDAQFLFGMGGGRHRLHPGQHRADRDRRAGRLLGRDPELHHVQGHEPLDLQRDPGRLRHRQRGGGRRRMPRATSRSRRARPRTRPS